MPSEHDGRIAEMAVKKENKRVNITMDEMSQRLYSIQERRNDLDEYETTLTNAYRGALRTAMFADWVRKPVESMSLRELCLFAATYDAGIGLGSDDVVEGSTANTDENAYEKALARIHELSRPVRKLQE